MSAIEKRARELCEKAGGDPDRVTGRYEMIGGEIRTFYAWEYFRTQAIMEVEPEIVLTTGKGEAGT